ncbi:MAG TPA: helix-turn-helix transcriptional regulator [Oscillatoriaceae cyanobacterium]
MSETVLIDPAGTLSSRHLVADTPVISSVEELKKPRAKRFNEVWIVPTAETLNMFLASPGDRAKGGNRRVLVLDFLNAGHRELLHYFFGVVVSRDVVGSLLPDDELFEVLAAPNREELLIGGFADQSARLVVLYKGNLEPVLVPFDWFTAGPKSPQPDFGRLDVVDYGHYVRLGTYEAATDAILYEFDAGYRKRQRENRLHADTSFGGALKRLRLQRGMSRSQFPGVSAKEIARIERGEVGKPHAKTLGAIAECLGVKPEEIDSY